MGIDTLLPQYSITPIFHYSIFFRSIEWFSRC